MRTLRYARIDVFTDRPFLGNALAVFTDARGLAPDKLQALAREMNLSETVFVLPPEAGGHARLRIFTPSCELPFAGHPVLGAAFALGGPLQSELVRLETGVGIIPVRLEREGARVAFGWFSPPLPKPRPISDPAPLLAALGLARSELPVIEYDSGIRHVIVTADSAHTVHGLRPDYARLAAASPEACVNVVSITPGSDEAGAHQFCKLRNFAVAFGIHEDPATGSAAGPLAAHLLRHGRLAPGQTLRIDQGAEVQRPSELFAVAHGTPETLERLEVGGSALVIGRGEIVLH